MSYIKMLWEKLGALFYCSWRPEWIKFWSHLNRDHCKVWLNIAISPPNSRFNDSDHLKDPDLYSDKSDREGEQDHEESDPEGLEKSEESDSDTSERQDDSYVDLDPNEHLRETPYLEQSHEELGEVGGDAGESFNQSVKKCLNV